MTEEGKIRKEKKKPPHLVVIYSGATPRYSIWEWVQNHSLSSQFKFTRSRTSGLFSHSYWVAFCKYFLEWKRRKRKKKNNLTNSVRALLLTNLLCPRDPAGCAAMLPAALFRKVTFASPSVRLLTAFPQKWVSLCLPEIAGEQNKSRFNE